MKQIKTTGIVLTRTDYGEADRIITFLTPDQGKVRLFAKSVRKSKSKLAGGIELFSVSELCYIIGRGETYTLTSSRLTKHYGQIVKDLDRTNTAYEIIRLLNKATEDHPEPVYFQMIQEAFQALDDVNIDPQLSLMWFNMQLLKHAGHAPNLKTDLEGEKLDPKYNYDFHLERMSFGTPEGRKGNYNANHIKFLRLGFAAQRPHLLQRVEDVQSLSDATRSLVQTMLASHVRV